jgi:cytochrome oxidase assembly protein ShyY1
MSRSRTRQVWIAVIAGVVAATCVGLGFWQLRRLEERRALNASITRRGAAPTVVIPSAHGEARPAPFRLVTAEGTYDTEHEVLVYGRTLDGESGHDVVTPLVLADGTGVLVIRGWVPFEMQTAPVPGAVPPPDPVSVEGFLVPDEGDGSNVPDTEGVVRRLDVSGIASSLPYDVYPLAVQLTGQVPPQPGRLPILLPRPELSEGPHLSYAIQWFSFATIAVVGGIILIRRDRRSTRADP